MFKTFFNNTFIFISKSIIYLLFYLFVIVSKNIKKFMALNYNNIYATLRNAIFQNEIHSIILYLAYFLYVLFNT